MKTITFILDNGYEKLTWYENSEFTYNEFCSKVLGSYLKSYDVSITSVVKVSDQGSTTTFNLTFDN